MKIQTVKIRADNAKGYKIVNADDSRAVNAIGAVLTRADIAKMPKRDVAELLAAHGVEADGKVAEMRDQLTDIMFVDL
jgi:hypothetical protein